VFLRHKHKGHGGGPNSIAWMVSYADMATILLAMFIVLSTLSKDQTGISLFRGTGSFRHALNNFGAPGLFANSDKVAPLTAPGPQHAVTPSDDPRGLDPVGGRVIDAEQEHLQRFLDEAGRTFAVSRLPRIAGSASFDFHEPFAKSAPYLQPAHNEVLNQLLPLLRRENYRLQVIVWAPTPSETATVRAANQADEVAREVRSRLDPAVGWRVIGVGQIWRFRDVRRPVFSATVIKTE
jgi:hypothetical protein